MKKQIFTITGALLLFMGVLTLKMWIEPEVLLSKKKRFTVLPKIYSVGESGVGQKALGFQQIVADSIWIKLLQEAEHTPIGKDEVSWEFVQLEKITALNPAFTDAYSLGSIYLSSFRRDKQGALFFLNRWRKYYPDFWKAEYMLGFHYQYELNDPEKAAQHILKAATMVGAPPWLTSLGIRMFSEKGGLFQSLQLAIDLYPYMNSTEARDRLTMRIRALNFNLQKHVWMEAREHFVQESKRAPASLRDIPKSYVRSALEKTGLESLNIPNDDDLKILVRESFAFEWDSKAQRVVALSPDTQALENVGISIPKTKKESK